MYTWKMHPGFMIGAMDTGLLVGLDCCAAGQLVKRKCHTSGQTLSQTYTAVGLGRTGSRVVHFYRVSSGFDKVLLDESLREWKDRRLGTCVVGIKNHAPILWSLFTM